MRGDGLCRHDLKTQTGGCVLARRGVRALLAACRLTAMKERRAVAVKSLIGGVMLFQQLRAAAPHAPPRPVSGRTGDRLTRPGEEQQSNARAGGMIIRS